jgi:large subunit ribosomal protein L29
MKNRENYSALSSDELKDRLIQVQQDMENMLLQKATHQLNNPLRLRTVRREIARIKTYMHQHELGIHKVKQ